MLRDWLKAENDPNVMILKYEYLVGLNQKEAFEKIFDFCGIQMPRKEMNRLLDRYSFKKLSGRRPGEEDHRSHYRKGTPGDWRSHFTPEHASLFKKMTGDLVVQLGYEKANNW